MIDRDAIKLEFRNRLLDELEDFDEGQLKVDNREFDPPNPSDLWMRETLIPSEEKLIANNELELLAILQYDIFVPLNTGTTQAYNLARRIGELFKATEGFDATNDAEEEFQVCIYRASLLGGSESGGGGRVRDGQSSGGGWYTQSVQIFFRAYAQNHSTT